MANVRRTAMGNAIDIDRLRLANETTIAVGNSNTNARGDLLGPGGQIVKTRAQIQQEYYKLNTPMADHEAPVLDSAPADVSDNVQLAQPAAEDAPVVETSAPGYVKPRGSFAEAIADETEIKQELLQPLTKPAINKGVQRI